MTAAPSGLAALEARLAQDIDWLALPANHWVPEQARDGERLVDVAIIGGGMSGLTVATALKQLGITAVIYDEAPEGLEGPWATTARMDTLRSPKTLTGPALGLPALTFRAWFEAQFGLEAWHALDKIPRLMWMDYLIWYRKVMQVDVRNSTRITLITPRADGCVRLDLENAGGTSHILARRVILATGRDGLGGPSVPPIAQSLPREVWAHSADRNDYDDLKGKRVGVIGAGASAMDSAGTALEAGAASVDLLIRRFDIPRINKGKGAGNPGAVYGHATLAPQWKWRIRTYINRAQVPPPRLSVLRVSQHANARFNLGCALIAMRKSDEGVVVETSKKRFVFDFVIFSTGFKIDLKDRPFLSPIAPHIRLWSDEFTPPKGQEDQELSDSPWLGENFEFLPKEGHDCEGLERIHCFCYPAALSHGTVSGDIPAISDGARKLAQGLAALLYQEDIEQHYANLEAYAEPEVFGDEWTPAP